MPAISRGMWARGGTGSPSLGALASCWGWPRQLGRVRAGGCRCALRLPGAGVLGRHFGSPLACCLTWGSWQAHKRAKVVWGFDNSVRGRLAGLVAARRDEMQERRDGC